jgi:hypothetical protein
VQKTNADYFIRNWEEVFTIKSHTESEFILCHLARLKEHGENDRSYLQLTLVRVGPSEAIFFFQESHFEQQKKMHSYTVENRGAF